MNDQTIRGLPWTLLSYTGSRVVSVITTLVLARLVVPADFGLLALATLATNFLTWIADMGFSGTLVVRQDLDRRGMGTLLTLMILTGVCAGLIAVAIAPLAALLFSTPRLTGVLAAIAALLPLGSIAGFWDALLQREFAFRQKFIGMISQAVVTAAVAIPMAAAGAGVWSLVVGQIIGMVVQLFVMVGLAPYRVWPAYDAAIARDAFSTGRGFLFQGLAMYVRQNVDTFSVGLVFGDRQLGFYSMANRFGDLVYWAIAHPVAKVTFPIFAKGRFDGLDIRPSFLRVLGYVALASCPIGVMMSAAADPFTRAVFGARWIPMIGPLAIMGLWAAVRQIDQTLGWLLNSMERAGTVAWLSLFILVPLIIGCAVATSVGGLTLVALVPLADTLLSAALSARLVRRHAEIGYGELWQSVRPAVLASFPTWVATWAVGQAVGPVHQPILSLVLALSSGTLIYLSCVRLIAPAMFSESVVWVTRRLSKVPDPAPS